MRGEWRSQQSTVDSLQMRAKRNDRISWENRGIGRTRGVYPGFWDKSAEDVGKIADGCDTENERVRKGLKRKSGESEDRKERERKCRRADIF